MIYLNQKYQDYKPSKNKNGQLKNNYTSTFFYNSHQLKKKILIVNEL